MNRMPKQLGADEVNALGNLARGLPWHTQEVRAIEPPRRDKLGPFSTSPSDKPDEGGPRTVK
jgi:hypothetical protein